VTRNALGEGSAWYVSTRVEGGDLERLVQQVLADAGVPEREGRVAGVEVVERRSDDALFTFWLNHTDADVTVAAPAGTELLTDATVDGSLTVAGGGVAVLRSELR
jgi:beta-galactosidase